MKIYRLLLAVLVFVGIYSCEDVPCRRNMVNPSLIISYYEKDSLASPNQTVWMDLNSINLTFDNKQQASYHDTIITSNYQFRIPLLPDYSLLNIFLGYDSLKRFEFYDTIIKKVYIPNDTLNKGDTMYIDDIRIEVDSFTVLYQPKDSNIPTDTLQKGMAIYGDEIKVQVDNYTVVYALKDSAFTNQWESSYFKNFNNQINITYHSELVPVSEECGFSYEYIIDSIRLSGTYFDTSAFKIINKKVFTPESLYDEQPENIQILF